MIYKLLDADNNVYELNGSTTPSVIRGSISRGLDSYTFKQEVVERSFLPGSIIVGTPRILSRDFSFESSFSFQTDLEFDTYINGLISFLERATLLQDVTNNKQCAIAVNSINAVYDKGCIKRCGTINIVVKILDGFWTDIIATTINQSLIVGNNNIIINNTGYLSTYGEITIIVNDLCPQIDLYIDETKEGLQLVDNTLGTPLLSTLKIDNKSGSLTIQDFNRSQSIVDGTGYFSFPIGSNTLVVEIPVSGNIQIEYHRRYFI